MARYEHSRHMKNERYGIGSRVFLLICTAGVSQFLISCGSEKNSPKKREINTLETFVAEDAIKDYGNNASHNNDLDVKQAMNELESEIRELEIRINKMDGKSKQKAQQTLERLKTKADELENEFDQKKWEETKREVSGFFNGLGNEIEQGFKDLGNEIEDTFDK